MDGVVGSTGCCCCISVYFVRITGLLSANVVEKERFTLDVREGHSMVHRVDIVLRIHVVRNCWASVIVLANIPLLFYTDHKPARSSSQSSSRPNLQ